mgnify:CR=1 FL=1
MIRTSDEMMRNPAASLRAILDKGRYVRRLCAYFQRRRSERHWLATGDIEPRIRDVLASPDLARIPKAGAAGQLRDGVLTMHNGLLVHAGSYSGDAMTRLLTRTGGVHEPQEEVVFAALLKSIAAGSAMLELGAWWGFYSMWFQSEVERARNILVEPEMANIDFGRRNFELNGMSGEFLRRAAGATTSRGVDPPVFAVDDLLDELGIERLAILHADIQGAEHEMLRGAANSLAARRIDWLFLSTHTHALHFACRDLLAAHGYRVPETADLLDTYSYDGLLVASAAAPPFALAIAAKSGHNRASSWLRI